MDKYIVLSFIGEGSFGKVFKVKNKETDGIFALKVIRKKGRSSKDLKNLRQECDIQQHLRHPNIIRMIESFDTDSDLFVVTEFAEKELHGVLGKEGCLQEVDAQVLTWDLVSALYYLHSHRVLHRDLKPQNVLIDASGKAKLCDFGLARNMTTGTHVLTSIKGTPLYMAPELIDEKPYDHQADLWSLGCIVYEMMAGQPPFSTSSIVQLVRLIRHRPVQWPSYISPQAVSFLQGLLHKDPALRLSWPEILIHPFVAGHIFIVTEQSPMDSPFTLPLSQSQLAAKQIQKDRLNSVQRLMPQAVKILERREKLLAANAKSPRMVEGVAVSDDDSIRAVSAISVRDSLRTDDEEMQPLSTAHANLLAHEYAVLNQDNLIISNLDTNMAQLAIHPRMPVLNENKELILEDNTQTVIENKLKPEVTDNITDKTVVTSDNVDLNQKKLSQNLDNFSIRLKSNSQPSKDEQNATHSVGYECSEEAVVIEKETSLSKSVPPSYKQKLIQFSRDKFGFGSGNRLTRSLKKSLHFNKISDKVKSDKGRRMSEPAELNSSQINFIESKVKDSEDEKGEEEVPEISENLKLSDINNTEGQNFIDDDSAPIEKDEWLAFMRSNMNEVMEGDVESLTQQNIVSMVVGVARHSGAGAEVRGSLAALLSLPLVAPHVPRQTISAILRVYLEVKLVPNLVYASRLLVRQSAAENNNSSNCPVRSLTAEEMVALCRLLELTVQLCLRGAPFVQQVCDAVAVLNTAPLLAQFLSLYDKRLRIVLNTVTLLTVILQDFPENAELVESVLFESECVDLCVLLVHQSDTLRIRTCVLIGLLGRYCCSALCGALGTVWGVRQKEALESLQTHSNQNLSRAAKCAVRDLSKLPFYNQTSGRK